MRERSKEMLLTNSHIPYYYQIAEVLRRKMERGELGVGEKLPKEMDLAEMFGVSRIPVRQALSLLASEGFLNHKRGRGTFVRERIEKPESFRLTGVIGGKITKGKEHRMIAVENVSPTQQLAGFFDLSPGENLTRFRRLRLENKKPYCYIINYLSAEMGRKISGAQFEKKSMIEILKERFRASLGKIQQTIEARTADSEIAQLLSIGVMGPVLYVETFVRGKDGEPIEFSQIYYRGDQHKYSIEVSAESLVP